MLDLLTASRMRLSPVREAEQIAWVAKLAAEIWREHYASIIGRAQVEYMLDKFQSAHAIAAQIDSGHEYFLIESNGELAGYAAVVAEQAEQRLFLSKLYVRNSTRRAGVARSVLQVLETLGKARGLQQIYLTVNKQNPALQAYLRLGFANTGPVVADIGGGFVMDDYRMEKTIV